MPNPNPQRSSIPKMLKGDIERLAQRIKPIISFDGVRRYINPVHLFAKAFTWHPIPAEEASGLRILHDIDTYHRYEYDGKFKPTIAEVLAQISKMHQQKVVAFEIIKYPQTVENTQRRIVPPGIHSATTRLYVRA